MAGADHNKTASGQRLSPRSQNRPSEPAFANWGELDRQTRFMDELARVEVHAAAIDERDLNHNFAFQAWLETQCRDLICQHEEAQLGPGKFDRASIGLKCFGSLRSGYATKSSDMDLALLSPCSKPPPCSADSPIPRLIEKTLLDKGFGARLLTKTRVPIIKLCEKPTPELLAALRDERSKWESRPVQDSVTAPPPEAAKKDSPESVEKLRGPGSVAAEQLRQFSQREGENLFLYYRRAKALLEKLGGMDINSPHNQNQSADKMKVLNAVSKAFVDGIQDEALLRRLRASKSMDFQRNIRSVAGVWYQAEGERIVMSWEGREVTEASEAKERQGQLDITEWHQLQDKITPDIVNFNKSLQRYWERLKTLASAKVGILCERHDESPEMYYVRCVGILKELGCRDLAVALSPPLSTREQETRDVMVRRFVDGIQNEAVRGRIQQYIASNRRLSLAAVFAQYDAESQINRLEKAASLKDHVTDADEAVRHYADSVRLVGASAVDASTCAAFRHLVDTTDAARSQPIKKASTATNAPHAGRGRDRHFDHLEFPKSGVGIQCDINFSNYLALHNTLLLRCYHLCDARVRPVVLFVKAWTKRRMINSPYRGTLSSYGYVLMVLHYLVNIVDPPVLPNLQLSWKPTAHRRSDPVYQSDTVVDGYNVRFWRDEREIQNMAARGFITQNKQTVGSLLRGFFDYYARQGPMVIGHGFSWQMDALSLRTPGGLLPKRVKGWTGAKTTTTEAAHPGQERKEIRHRYLCAIEDPFETDHNIARTVTHPGIVGIRDEFRRAWRIISNVGRAGGRAEEGLFDHVVDPAEVARKALEEARAPVVGLVGLVQKLGVADDDNTATAETGF